MYFVQNRRSMRALYWFVGVIGLILAATSVFGNVIVHGSVHHIVDYRKSSSDRPVQIDLFLLPYLSEDVPWPAFPWGKLTHDQVQPFRQRPRHQEAFVFPRRDFVYKERTAVGTFVESDHIPRQHVVIYPNGYRNIVQIVTVKAPNGRPVQWHDEFKIDGVDAFDQTVSLQWMLAAAVVLCALLGVVIGVGLGEDVSNHLAIVRTRPVSKTTFVLSTIGIDVALLTIGVGLVGLLLYAAPIGGYRVYGASEFDVWRNPSPTDTAVKSIALALIWSMTLACYGMTLALTTARKRVTALVVLSAVAVIELIISSSIGYGLPHPLAWIKPALDALNPIGHYAIVYANIYPSHGLPTDSLESTIHSLLALLGLAVVGMLIATLRWRAARI